MYSCYSFREQRTTGGGDTPISAPLATASATTITVSRQRGGDSDEPTTGTTITTTTTTRTIEPEEETPMVTGDDDEVAADDPEPEVIEVSYLLGLYTSLTSSRGILLRRYLEKGGGGGERMLFLSVFRVLPLIFSLQLA